MLKTNTKIYKANFKKELNNVLLDYSDNGYCDNINDLVLCFNSETNNEYNKRRLPNLNERFADYLSGLPYGFNFTWREEILEFSALVHGIKEIPENKEDLIVNNFYNHCATMILRIADKTTVAELY